VGDLNRHRKYASLLNSKSTLHSGLAIVISSIGVSEDPDPKLGVNADSDPGI